MAILFIIQTQVRENYGAHDWDGKGECPQSWKNKGGEEYIYFNCLSEKVALAHFEENHACNDDYFHEYVVGIEKVEAKSVDTYRSYDEKCQLEYDGKIEYPSTRIDLGDWDHQSVREEKERIQKEADAVANRIAKALEPVGFSIGDCFPA